MKKYITFLLLLLLLPTMVFAKGYQSTDLEGALKDEKIKYDLGDYEETDEKVTVYLFRGKGCGHCHEFLEYVSKDLIKEYGQYFKVKAYEVWYNKDNASLMEQVAKHFEEEASGVPYIVIGDKTFSGYSTSMNDEIKEAIKKLYDSEEKYDVFNKMNVSVKESKKETKKDKTLTTIIVVAALVGVVVLVLTSNKKQK